MVFNVRSMAHWDFYHNDGFVYNCNKTVIATGTKYLICKDKEKKKCPGKCTLRGENFIITSEHKYHGRRSTEKIEAEIAFRRSLNQASVTSLVPLRTIYNTLILLHPQIAEEISFKNIERTMLRWRRNTKLPDLNSYSQTCEILYQEEWEFLRSYSVELADPQQLTVENVIEEVLFIYDSKFIESLTDVSNIYISNSTSIKLNLSNSKFLTTVIAEIKNYAFPIMWIFSSSDDDDYMNGAVIAMKCRRILRNLVTPNITIYTDFQYDLYKKISLLFDKNIEGTFENYCQILRCIAVEKSIDTNDERLQNLLKEMMILTLLPSDRIEVEFQNIKNKITENEERELLDDFFSYFTTDWIEKVTPAKFSFFNKIKAINDVSVIHLRVLQRKLNTSNPNFWQLLDVILRIMTKSRNDLTELLTADKPKVSFTPKINYSFNDKHKRSMTFRVEKLWETLNGNSINSSEFVKRGIVVMHEFFSDFFFDDTRIVDKHQTAIYLDFEAINNAFFANLPEVSFASNSDTICQICKNNLVETINYPCYHVDTCLQCARVDPSGCTICLVQVRRKERIFLPKDESERAYDLNCQICGDIEVSICWQPCNHGLSCSTCAEKVHRFNGILKCPHCNCLSTGFIEFELPIK